MKKNSRKKSGNHLLSITCMTGPTISWLMLFLALPIIYICLISFMTRSRYSGVEWIFSLEGYKSLLNPLYVNIILDSLVLAFQTTLICLLVAYPFAYILAKMRPSIRGFCILLVMLPFWINGLIRLDGWSNIIRETGVINTFLMHIGVISEPIRMLKTDGAVLFGMVYTFLPFMILPLQTSISKIDPSLIEAAQDLGAGRIRTFGRVILPLTLPGIFSGTIQVFIPSLGAFYISDMMGDGSLYLGNLINNLFQRDLNWPAGAAFAVILTIITLIALKLYSKIGSPEDLA